MLGGVNLSPSYYDQLLYSFQKRIKSTPSTRNSHLPVSKAPFPLVRPLATRQPETAPSSRLLSSTIALWTSTVMQKQSQFVLSYEDIFEHCRLIKLPHRQLSRLQSEVGIVRSAS